MFIVRSLVRHAPQRGAMSMSKALPIGLTSCDLIPQRRATHCTPGGVRLNNELWSEKANHPRGVECLSLAAW